MTDEKHGTGDGQQPDSREAAEDKAPARLKGGAPEPPPSYKPQPGPSMPANQGLSQNSETESLRRMISAAQIMALVSFVVGGVMLSSAAIVVAIMSYRKASNASQGGNTADPHRTALKRSAAMALAMSIIAFVANAVAFAVLYPKIAEMLQTGDYSSLWTPSETPTTAADSFWG